MPDYVSLKNQANNEFRNDHDTKMYHNFESPNTICD